MCKNIILFCLRENQVIRKLGWIHIDHIGMRVTLNGGSYFFFIISLKFLLSKMDGSEFLSVASGVNVSNLLTVLDEHMDVIKLLHPKEYDTLIQKIREPIYISSLQISIIRSFKFAREDFIMNTITHTGKLENTSGKL